MMFTQHILARTDRHFHEVSYRAAQTASDSQEVHEIDNKVMIVFSSRELNESSFNLHACVDIVAGYVLFLAWAERQYIDG